MKPIVLTMEAFGPYIDRTTVDFETLSEAGLFLISGSTGGGKTTLLDAMSMALYGRSTGGRRDFHDMRSLAAAETQSTEVDFQFALGDTQYRFRRALQMKKKRGAEHFEPVGLNECFRLEADAWVPMESGAGSRVTACAQSLLSLTAEQFSQVIVLPQGEFLRLLRASSHDKADILKTLFSSEIWGRVTFKLNERLKEVEAKNRDTDSALRTLLEKHGAESQEALAAHIEALRETCAAAEAERDKAQTQRAAAQTALDSALLYARLKAAWAQADEAERNAAVRLSAAETNAKTAQAGRAEIDTLQKAAEARAHRTEALKAEAARIAQYEAAAKRLSEETARGSALQKAVEQAEAVRAEALAAIRKGEAYAEEIQLAANQIPLLMQEKARLSEEIQRLCDLESAEKALVQRRAAAEKAAEAARQCRLSMTAADKSLSAAEAGLRADSAAHLAAFLTDGTPCPVCGAAHHPAPATPADRQVTREECDALRETLEALRRDFTAAESGAAASRAQLRDAEAAFETAKSHAPAGTDRASSEAALADCTAALSGAEKTAAHRDAALKKLAVLRGSADDAARRGADSAAELAASRGALEQLRAAAEAFGTLRTADAVQAALQSESAAADAEAARRTALEDALRTAGEALAAAGAHSAAAHAAAAEAAKALEPYRDKAPASADDARAALTEAEDKLSALSVSLGGAAEALHSAEESQAAVQRLLQSAEGLRRTYSRVARLSKLLSGKNAMHTPILQYVLSMMLEETIYSANRFFAILSRERYALRRMTAPKGGQGYSGLDIEVLDGMSGTCRSIETLSGGEQFLAALSLAFGLSEVVQSYSGAVRLDSIFIDEGFGSLDGDTLDTAMRALGTIRASGRVVGIISHVAELKDRIPAMIRVTQKSNGSAAAAVITE